MKSSMTTHDIAFIPLDTVLKINSLLCQQLNLFYHFDAVLSENEHFAHNSYLKLPEKTQDTTIPETPGYFAKSSNVKYGIS